MTYKIKDEHKIQDILNNEDHPKSDNYIKKKNDPKNKHNLKNIDSPKNEDDLNKQKICAQLRKLNKGKQVKTKFKKLQKVRKCIG